MAHEYRITATYAEALDQASSAVAVSAVVAEALQVDDDPTDVRVSTISAEALQVDDEPTDLRLSGLYVEVLCDVNSTVGQYGSIAFAPEMQLSLGGELDPGPRLAFRSELTLRAGGEKYPNFSCEATPAPKAWGRAVVAAKEWARIEVTPAEHCTADTDPVADVLATLAGDLLTTLDDNNLQLNG